MGKQSTVVSPAAQLAQALEYTHTAEPNPELPTGGALRGRKRKSVTQDAVAESTTSGTKQKRCRRAPSPSIWVPDSLKYFDLTPQQRTTPVPLPPVQPYGDIEERDSLDETVAISPYHPQGWKGKLPGPGVMEKDITNTSGGRILVF